MLSWTVTNSDGGKKIYRFIGEITEDVDFVSLVNDLDLHGGEFDLGGIDHINSCGVREWILFVRALDQKQIPFSMTMCSPSIVGQMNMISNFKGNGVVESIAVPYYCKFCEHEEFEYLNVRVDSKNSAIMENRVCSECGRDAEFDDDPESYLAFLSGG